MTDKIFDSTTLERALAFARREHNLLIDGQSKPAISGARYDVINPATCERLASVAQAGAEDLELAVKVATEAFNSRWSPLPPNERQRLLWRLSDLIEKNADELAVLETLNNGKPVREARFMDITNAINTLRYCAGWTTKLNGETVSVSHPGSWHSYTVRQPYAVAGLITPWNAPIMMAVAKIAPALAAGCCAILKPAEHTPLTAIRIGEIALEAGIPPGVLNILPGLGTEVGEAIVSHSAIEKISFTGSGCVGQRILATASHSLKRVTVELGGKSANIIMPDADLTKAIPGSAKAIFGNAGQICNAGSRLYVHSSVYDKTVEGIAEFAHSLVVGNGLSPDTQMGPLISRPQLERVCAYIDSGLKDGASLITGGKTLDIGGHFIEPTIIANTRQSMSVVQEEIFGPVLAVQRFDDADDLAGIAELANGTHYGLGAMLWTNDLSKAHKLAARFKAGTVRINGGGLDPALPFGGFKHSGIGRESGREGVEAYTEEKSVMIAL